ncbi:MAG: nitroreductase family protein [Acidobacteria bacterium]|nr:nitroreductase family protein [Acidobacteriota bacterium]
MDVKEAIENRRSIRWYDGKKVPDKVIDEILDAARRAPSGCNAQPWRFRIVRDRETVEKLKRKKAFPQDFVYQAPAIVVCCTDPAAYAGRYGGENQVEDGTVPEDPVERKAMFRIVEEKAAARALRDLSIASAFMVLRATELGLGTSYIGLIEEAVLHEALEIPGNLIIPFVITMGYAARLPSRTPRKELREILL